MKRIFVFAGYFYPHSGGGEKNIYDLSKRLAQKGHEIYIITCNTDGGLTTENVDGLHIHRLPSWNIMGGAYPVPKPVPRTFKTLFQLLRKERVDVVNTQTRFFVTSLIGLLFAQAKRAPLVHTERGATHTVSSNRFVTTFSKMYDHTIGSLIVRRAKRNIGVSQAACDFVRHLGARNTVVIPNGVDTALFREVCTDLRGRLGLQNAVVIAYVGRLIYAKGVHDLISVFGGIERRFENVVLLVVGGGAYRKKLESMATAMGGSRVVFFGEKNHNEIVEILSITDVFVNPSYSEGLPTSVMEAAAVGLPIVATNVGGTSEIIDDGKNGFLVAPGDTRVLEQRICQLIENTELRGKFATGIRDFVRQSFDWDEITDKWIREVIPEWS